MRRYAPDSRPHGIGATAQRIPIALGVDIMVESDDGVNVLLVKQGKTYLQNIV
jgi:hypothetical protein